MKGSSSTDLYTILSTRQDILYPLILIFFLSLLLTVKSHNLNAEDILFTRFWYKHLEQQGHLLAEGLLFQHTQLSSSPHICFCYFLSEHKDLLSSEKSDQVDRLDNGGVCVFYITSLSVCWKTEKEEEPSGIPVPLPGLNMLLCCASGLRKV